MLLYMCMVMGALVVKGQVQDRMKEGRARMPEPRPPLPSIVTSLSPVPKSIIPSNFSVRIMAIIYIVLTRSQVPF